MNKAEFTKMAGPARREARQVMSGRSHRRLPERLRRRVVELASAARAEGIAWSTISKELGVAAKKLQRWVKADRESVGGGLVAVRVQAVAEREGGGLTIVMPSGVRLEGVGPEQAATLLRALG